MTRYLLLLALGGAAALLAPSRALAQEKPSLNTAPGVPVKPAPAQPVPAPEPTPVQPAPTAPEPAPAPAAQPLPAPSYGSPSGFELPKREQQRKALQEHAEMYSKLFLYGGISPGYYADSYSSVLTLGVSPALGYRITDRIAVGPGFTYTYNNYGFDTNINTTKHIGTNTLGFKVFGQAMVYKQFLAHVEYETTKAEVPVVDANYNILKASYQVSSLLAGAGYRSQISTRAAIDLLLLYNFNDSTYGSVSLYHNPVVRFNFLFNIGH